MKFYRMNSDAREELEEIAREAYVHNQGLRNEGYIPTMNDVRKSVDRVLDALNLIKELDNQDGKIRHN